MQTLTFTEGGQTYLSHKASQVGGSWGQRFQTRITLQCSYESKFSTDRENLCYPTVFSSESLFPRSVLVVAGLIIDEQ